MFFGDINENKKQNYTKKEQIKGENITTRIDASIYEAFYGAEKQIALKTPEGETKT